MYILKKWQSLVLNVTVPIADTDYSRKECMEGDENCPKEKFRRERWTIDGKITCVRLKVADKPAKNDFEVLPDLTIESTL